MRKLLLLLTFTIFIESHLCFAQINSEVILKGGTQISLASIIGAGFSYGVGYQSNLNEVFSVGLHLSTGNVSGLSTQMWNHSSKGGGLVEPFYKDYETQDGWFPSYQFKSTALDLDLQLRPIEAFMFDKITNKWNPYLKGSVGLVHKSTKLDLLDQNGLPYDNLLKIASSYEANTVQGRKDISKALLAAYDGTYETKLSNYDPISIQLSYGGGLSYQLSAKVKIGLEYTVIYFPDFKYMDGILFRTASDEVNGTDKLINASFCLGYKL